METIAISKFKATCLAVLENVRKTGRPILVTRFGKPIAEITPASAEATQRKLGFMLGTLGGKGLEPGEGTRLIDEDETVREWDELHAQPAGRAARSRKQRSRNK